MVGVRVCAPVGERVGVEGVEGELPGEAVAPPAREAVKGGEFEEPAPTKSALLCETL